MRTKAFTLIELMVSVGILVAIMFMFGMVMTSVQNTTSAATVSRNRNNQTTSISHLLRRDFRRITKNGFLCITEVDGNPRILFTTAGPSESLTSSVVASAACVCYGIVANQAKGATDNIFWRQGWVLFGPGLADAHIATGKEIGADVWLIDLSDFWPGPPPIPPGYIGIPEAITTLCAVAPPADPADPFAIKVPPQSAIEVSALWQCVALEADNLVITWTDGALSGGRLIWYGSGNPCGDPEIESSLVPYHALWNNENQNNWPRAIRIRAEFAGEIIEIIASVGP